MGIIPTRDELSAELLRQAEELYDGEWAPGGNGFNQNKPVIWRTARSICRRYGYSQDADGWRNLVNNLTGLNVPTQSQYINQAYSEKRYAADVGIIRKQRLFNEGKIQCPQYIPMANLDITLSVCSERVVGDKIYRMLR